MASGVDVGRALELLGRVVLVADGGAVLLKAVVGDTVVVVVEEVAAGIVDSSTLSGSI